MKIKDLMNADFDINADVEVYDTKDKSDFDWAESTPVWATYPGIKKWKCDYEEIKDLPITYMTTNTDSATIVIETQLPKEFEVCISLTESYVARVKAAKPEDAIRMARDFLLHSEVDVCDIETMEAYAENENGDVYQTKLEEDENGNWLIDNGDEN